MTALMWVARNGYIEIVKILLNPTDVNAWDNYGNTALMHVLLSQEHAATQKLPLCEILVAAGAFIQLQNFEKKTVLDMTEDKELLAWLKLKKESEKIEQMVWDKILEAGENKQSAEQQENKEDLVSVFNQNDKQTILTFSGSSHAYLEVSTGGGNILHYAIMQEDIKQVPDYS